MSGLAHSDPFRAESPRRLAVLIDADNAQATIVDALLREIAQYGEAVVKRIYGDFTSTHTASWKKVLNQHAIKPMQQFAYTTGKNATDSTLIIDAMDLLYTRRFDGFCLVSSDSDFTGLAMRLREEGLLVLGFGEQKTPPAFRNACHKFTLTEVLRPAGGNDGKAKSISVPSQGTETLPVEFLRDSILAAMGERDWITLSTFGHYLSGQQSDFDSRRYGYPKMAELIKGNPEIFDWETRSVRGQNHQHIYVRPKS